MQRLVTRGLVVRRYTAKTSPVAEEAAAACNAQALQRPQRQQRREMSSKPLLPFSYSNLGLLQPLVHQQPPSVLTNLSSLPEVSQLMDSPDAPFKSTRDALLRAMDIFVSYQKGGPEHLAMLALLAEWYQRHGDYKATMKTLITLEKEILSPSSQNHVTIAKAKTAWYNGDFSIAEDMCTTIIQNEYNDLEDSFNPQTTSTAHLASAISGKALCKLASMSTMEDAYSVRDYFAICSRFLQRHPSSPLAEAIAQNNEGVAEAAYAVFLQRERDVDVPMDAALRTWYKGFQRAKACPEQQMSMLLQSTLQTNIAWGVLNFEDADREDRLSKASEYAQKALKCHDTYTRNNPQQPYSEGLIRTLSIVAACCHEGGQAVTAEGLYKSALDKVKRPDDVTTSPLLMLEWKDAYLGYSRLCKDWDKRESESERWNKAALDLDAADNNDPKTSLPSAWKGKDGIYGALWFWTAADVTKQ